MLFKYGQEPSQLNNDADRRCDACWRIESLGHVLQVCPRTWGHRIKRHDALLEKFLQKMENRGWAVTRAPVITVRGGILQIPDAVLYSRNSCWVVDASVVADNADLDNAHVSKCVKYACPRMVPNELAFREGIR